MAYCERWSHKESDTLVRLERSTYLNTISPQMISGKIQGRFLAFISKIIQPTNVLDIGSFTGYSAMCLAEGLSKEGKVHSIEISREVVHIREQNLENDPLYQKIIWHEGNALDLIPALPQSWELIFLDAAKHLYPELLTSITNHTQPGAILIADNVLWYGKVLLDQKDAETKAIHAFNQMLFEGADWESFIIPLRDGLSLSIRK